MDVTPVGSPTTSPPPMPLSPRRRMDSFSERNKSGVPFIIGVAGGTGSGKTTVCDILKAKTNPSNDLKRLVVLSQDQFYKDLPDGESPADYNFDHPKAFDETLLIESLTKLKLGQPITLQRYDVETCAHSKESHEVQPASVIILEGILVLYSMRVRSLLDMTIFVDLASDTRLSRRVTRDVARGRDLADVLTNYTTMVKPAFEEFAEPTKKYADLIIPRGSENTVAINLVVKHIKQILDVLPGDEGNVFTFIPKTESIHH
eukprot:m.30796 g.30796  ORF g.30796 m.30796 type:complete len:260 (-) comp16345_c0_seq1:46-825(-)